MGGIADDFAGDGVEASDIGHRMHHGNVRRPNIGCDVAGSHGGDHELWNADGQRPHGLCDHRSIAAAPEAQNSANVISRKKKCSERFGHGVNRLTAIGETHIGGKRDIGLGTGRRCRNINEQCRSTRRPDALHGIA